MGVFKIIDMDKERECYIVADCSKDYIEETIKEMGYYNKDIDWLVEKLISKNVKDVNFTKQTKDAIEVRF